MHETATLCVLFFAIAALYGSVGHAGASGYLAVMALVGVAPAQMKPTALVLNIAVATIATLNFRRAGVFYPRQVLPLVLTSVPMAFLGGMARPEATWYRPLVAAVLVVAASRALFRPQPAAGSAPAPAVPWPAALALGAVIGGLSGLTGTGGGIFLSPVVIAMGWATVRQSAGLSALFILLNSIAGLAGHAASMPALGVHTFALLAAASAGGFLGSALGAQRLPERPMSAALALVLLIAAAKLVWA